MRSAIFTALLLACLWLEPARAVLPVVEEGEAESGTQFLTIHSDGFSRFEIKDGDIVAHIVGGVEFDYLGYRLVADELYYNNATQVATASGGVSFAAQGISASAAEITLNGNEGEAELSGSINGHIQEQGFSFSADRVSLTFPPGIENPALENSTITIEGRVSASVPEYGQFATEKLLFNGATGELSSPGPFSAALVADNVQLGLSAADEAAAQEVLVSGTSLSGVVVADLGVETVTVQEPVLRAGSYELSGRELVLTAERVGEAESWRGRLSGKPVQALVTENGEQFSLNSDQIEVVVNAEGLQGLELSGRVVLSSKYVVLKAQEISLVQRYGGLRVIHGSGLDGDFNLAMLTGMTPIEIAQLSRLGRD